MRGYMHFRQFFRFQTIFLVLTVVTYGCAKKECMSPSPDFSFQIADADKNYPEDLAANTSVKVYYRDGEQKRYILSPLIQDKYFQGSTIISDSRSANDPELYLEVDQRILAKIKLETHTNNQKCNGWDQVSRVTQDGEVISKDGNHKYIFKSMQ